MRMRICSVVMVCVGCWLKIAIHEGGHRSAAGSVTFRLTAQAASRLRLRAGHRRGSVCGVEPAIIRLSADYLVEPPVSRCAEPRAAMPCGCDGEPGGKEMNPLGLAPT
jgi:hypothetical protein